MKVLLHSCFATALVAVFTQPAAAVEPRLTGEIRVIDGDTIALGETRIRLFGIDAVEGDQPCRATDGLSLIHI